jgi:hypothetical protein
MSRMAMSGRARRRSRSRRRKRPGRSIRGPMGGPVPCKPHQPRARHSPRLGAPCRAWSRRPGRGRTTCRPATRRTPETSRR